MDTFDNFTTDIRFVFQSWAFSQNFSIFFDEMSFFLLLFSPKNGYHTFPDFFRNITQKIYGKVTK